MPETSEWAFLLDENVDPKTATYLRKEGVDAEHVRDALWLGADDETDILPYARDSDRIVVTSDLSDFGDVAVADGPGIVLLYDDAMPAYEIAGALLSMVDAYETREAFLGREQLDDWA